MRQAPVHDSQVAAQQPALRLADGQWPERVGGHHRRQQPRHRERGEHRHGRGHAELPEELAGHASHEGRRQENRHQREAGGDHREADLVGGLHGRLERPLPAPEVAHDVLDLDDGVVDEDADDQRERQQRQDVEAEAQIVHRREGRYDGQRQGGRRDQRGAPVPQEPPDHDHGEHRALVEQLHGAAEVVLDGCDRVVCLGESHLRVLLLQGLHRLAHGVGDRDLARPLEAGDGEADHRPAVEQRIGGPLGDGVANPRDLVQAHAAPGAERDVEGADVADAVDRTQRAHGLHARADVSAPPRRVLLDLPQPRRDVGGRHAQRRHLRRVQLDADLAIDPADPVDGTDALHREQGLADVVVDEPGEGLLVEPARLEAERDDGPARSGDLGNHGVGHVLRQLGPHAVDRVAHVVERRLRARVDVELDPDQRRAVAQRRADVLDAAQRGHLVLDLAGDFGLELRGCRAFEHRADRHGRQLDVGEVLDAEGPEARYAEQRQQAEQQDGGDGIPDRPGRDVHRSADAAWINRTLSPSFRKAPPRATTRSSARTPARISTRFACRRPVSTLRSATRPSAVSANT